MNKSYNAVEEEETPQNEKSDSLMNIKPAIKVNSEMFYSSEENTGIQTEIKEKPEYKMFKQKKEVGSEDETTPSNRECGVCNLF